MSTLSFQAAQGFNIAFKDCEPDEAINRLYRACELLKASLQSHAVRTDSFPESREIALDERSIARSGSGPNLFDR